MEIFKVDRPKGSLPMRAYSKGTRASSVFSSGVSRFEEKKDSTPGPGSYNPGAIRKLSWANQTFSRVNYSFFFIKDRYHVIHP